MCSRLYNRRSGDQEIRRSGDQEIRRSGEPADFVLQSAF
jgi:hypothetical protein